MCPQSVPLHVDRSQSESNRHASQISLFRCHLPFVMAPCLTCRWASFVDGSHCRGMRSGNILSTWTNRLLMAHLVSGPLFHALSRSCPTETFLLVNSQGLGTGTQKLTYSEDPSFLWRERRRWRYACPSSRYDAAAPLNKISHS